LKRIDTLDSLRVIAIGMVMLFHYLYLYNGKFYEIAYLQKELFKYGYLGVELFFIISGFVITLTLKNSENIRDFIKKRYIRLFPGMLICSFITFIVFTIFDTQNLKPESAKFINFIFSNTFLSPALLNVPLKTNFQYIDAPYWSLWVEIQFYLLIGTIYFLSRKNFISIFITISILISVINFFYNENFLPENNFTSTVIIVVLGIFNYSDYASWFVCGVILYQVYFVKRNWVYLVTLLFSLLVAFGLGKRDMGHFVFVLFCAVLLYSFIYNLKYLTVLNNPLISKIGLASYSIYLIHQNVGILILNKLYHILPLYPVYAFAVMILAVIFGLLSYKYFEKPVGVFTKKMMKL